MIRDDRLDPDGDGVMLGGALIYAAAVILLVLTLDVWPTTLALLVAGFALARRPRSR